MTDDKKQEEQEELILAVHLKMTKKGSKAGMYMQIEDPHDINPLMYFGALKLMAAKLNNRVEGLEKRFLSGPDEDESQVLRMLAQAMGNEA